MSLRLAALDLSVLRRLAEEGGEAHTWLGVPFWIWQAVNLVLFVGLLVYLLKRPAAEFFAKRRAEVDEKLRRAEESRLRAERLARDVGEKLASIEAELAKIRESAAREAEAEKVALTEQAQVESQRLVARANAEIANRLSSARAELTAFAGDLAIEIAADVLKKSITPDDQKRLVNEGVAALAGKRG